MGAEPIVFKFWFSWTRALVVLLLSFITFASIKKNSCYASNAPAAPQEYLDLHNAARAEVGVGPITWDNKIAAFALDYANQVKARNGCDNLTHSGGPYGENLEGGNDYLNGRRAVEHWVSQKEKYDYQSNTCKDGADCWTYTQVVWKNSVRLGCARVLCYDGWGFVICNYDPPGNIIGQRPY